VVKLDITVASEAAVSGSSPDGTTIDKRRRKPFVVDKHTVVYGPYYTVTHKYGHVVLARYDEDGRYRKRTMSYNRFLLQKQLGYELRPGELATNVDGVLVVRKRRGRGAQAHLRKSPNAHSIANLPREERQALGRMGAAARWKKARLAKR
jgi:hypothetical protein